MSIVQLSPQLHQSVNLFKKLGELANMNVTKQESEKIIMVFDGDSRRIVGEKPDVRAWW